MIHGRVFNTFNYLSIENLLEILINTTKSLLLYRKHKGLSRCVKMLYLFTPEFWKSLKKEGDQVDVTDVYPQILLHDLISIRILPVMILLLL